MIYLSTLAVNVFGEEKKQDETVQQQNTQSQTQQPENKIPTSTGQETNSTTTQATGTQDDESNLLVNSVPWIASGIVAIVILVSLFAIIRKLNTRKS